MVLPLLPNLFLSSFFIFYKYKGKHAASTRIQIAPRIVSALFYTRRYAATTAPPTATAAQPDVPM